MLLLPRHPRRLLFPGRPRSGHRPRRELLRLAVLAIIAGNVLGRPPTG